MAISLASTKKQPLHPVGTIEKNQPTKTKIKQTTTTKPTPPQPGKKWYTENSLIETLIRSTRTKFQDALVFQAKRSESLTDPRTCSGILLTLVQTPAEKPGSASISKTKTWHFVGHTYYCTECTNYFLF